MSITPTTPFTGTQSYISPTKPLDDTAGGPNSNDVYAWNFGVLKQVAPVVGDLAASMKLTMVVLFSAPE